VTLRNDARGEISSVSLDVSIPPDATYCLSLPGLWRNVGRVLLWNTWAESVACNAGWRVGWAVLVARDY